METIPCDRCGGNGLVPVPGNAPSGTGRCPACKGLGQIERPTEEASKPQDRADVMRKPAESDSPPHEAE
jgi:hypothetical protein